MAAKSHVSTFRHPPVLRQRLDAAAVRAGVSRSDYMRLVLDDATRTKSPEDIRDLMREEARRIEAAKEAARAPDPFA